MVDALTKITKMLAPNGLLVDIHPQDRPVPIYVQVDDDITQVGAIDVRSKLAKYNLACEAVDKVIEQGLYDLCRQEIVQYDVYFDDLTTFQKYLAEEWTDAAISAETEQKISSLLQQNGTCKQIVFSESIIFNTLLPT